MDDTLRTEIPVSWAIRAMCLAESAEAGEESVSDMRARSFSGGLETCKSEISGCGNVGTSITERKTLFSLFIKGRWG